MSLAAKVIGCCRELAAYTEEPGRITRTFLSPPMRDVHRLLGSWMESLGMRVWIDAAGNLRGLHGDPQAPRLIIGSHLDTVPDAGAFDGILGFVLGIALIESNPRMAIEVVGFSEEEGVRFGFPFIGSRALAGTLGNPPEPVAAAIRAFGLDPAQIPAARLAPQSVAYLEFHIEQGPVLESLGLPLAVVESIVGQSRFTLDFEGRANHAGTTPMRLRHDALAAAAEWIVDVETRALATSGLVATTGSLDVSPGTGNVIPGRVRASLDIRHVCDRARHGAADAILAAAAEICARRGIGLTYDIRLDQPTVTLNPELRGMLARHVAYSMASGAGHDAMILAPHLPSAMLFLRSPGGISHHPDESVLPEDVEAAVEVGRHFIAELDARHV